MALDAVAVAVAVAFGSFYLHGNFCLSLGWLDCWLRQTDKMSECSGFMGVMFEFLDEQNNTQRRLIRSLFHSLIIA